MNNENLKPENDDNSSVLTDLIGTVLDMFKIIREHIIIFLLIIVFFTGLAYGYSAYSYEPLYKTEATFSIIPLVEGDASNGFSVYKFNFNANFAEQMGNTFPIIIGTENFREIIQNDLGRSINGTITGEPIYGTNIFVVNVLSSSYKDANDIMASFLNNFPKTASFIIGDTRINIVDEQKASYIPINSADHIRHTSYGLLFGLAIVLVIAFIIALKRETVCEKADVKEKLNSNCISEIPHIKIKRTSNNADKLIGTDKKYPEYTEAMRVAKKRVTEAMREGEQIIGITSSVSGEGKTTFSYNFARTLASSGKKTVLVDLDLYKRSLQGHLYDGSAKCCGLTEYCNGHLDISFDEIFSKNNSKFHILFAGSENIKYNNMKIPELFDILKEKFDYIVVDMPPLEAVSGATMLLNICEVMLFVVKRDSTPLSVIKSSLTNTNFTKSRFLGVVINDSDGMMNKYRYYKYYGYYGYGGYYGKYKHYGYRNRYRRYGSYGKYGGYGIDKTE